LPGGYELYRSSTHQIEIIPKEGWDPNNPPPMVPAKVVEVAFDDRFILAKRYRLKPDPKIRNYEIPDKTTAEYYILDALISKIYVCSNLDEFNKRRETLKVPATLKLKDITL
jgi:hypothetical protein